MEGWPSDYHLIMDNEDMLHEPTPDCPCKPRLLGNNADGYRVFEHMELTALLH